DIAGKKLCIVEDVVTSGGQIVISAGDLRERGAVIDTALCVIDRESGGPEALTASGLSLRQLFTASELQSAQET
ncbi:MAG: hypothetical protein KDI36_19905, partial [Pseudomonadales bacterium]|nr:hypothetical protein [Pseudomonadales bacterium]